ncbi:MAG: tetratricopeptide repeat protein [Armatimonadetes bacterium]|nr:tetratricopeptide repeat protein [Armatimonadota bacterium]
MSGQAETSSAPGTVRWSLFFFLLSGITALVYEVLWTRRLTLTFGHTVLAVSTVLTGFMAGLALGSLAGGRWADGASSRPGNDPLRFLAAYGRLELFVGLWGALSLPLLGLVEKLYLAVSTSGVTGLPLSMVCFAGSMLVLVPPTCAMGATVPVMSRQLVHQRGDIGRLLSRLYGINTLGAFIGAGLAGFLLLPWLGLGTSLLANAGINLAIGAAAIFLARTLAGPEADPAEPRAAAAAAEGQPLGAPGWIVPFTFGMAGLSSMAYQVGWTRALALSLGSSVYAFSTILVTFLAGLGLGSLLYPVVLRTREPRLAHLAFLQLGIGALGALTIPALGLLPYAFFKLFPLAQENFWRVLVIDVALSGALLAGPTFLMGLAFPLATHLYTRSLTRLGQSVGEVYSANTFGCILGAFVAGFLLVPELGAQRTLQLACLLNLGLAALVFWAAGLRLRWAAGAALAFGVAVLFLPQWRTGVMGGGVAIYSDRYQGVSLEKLDRTLFRPPAYYRDGLSCTVSLNFFGPEDVAMRVNGKVDVSLEDSDRQTMYLIGYLPALLHPAPKSVAVVGLGGGFTVEAFADLAEVERIDCAELEPAVVEAGRYWAGFNGHVLDDPRVHLRVTDGRTFILGSPRRFDVIASEPSNPWVAGVGNLFTRDFYRSCSQRLNPGGIMCQWFHIYSVSEQDMAMVLHSFFEAFPHGMVWQSAPGDLLLLGSNEPLAVDLDRIQRVWSGSPELQRRFFDIGLFRPDCLLGHYLFDRETALRAFGAAPLNTDDRPLLEFSAPLNLYGSHQVDRNQEVLWQYRDRPLPPGVEASPARMVSAAYGWLNIGDLNRVVVYLDRYGAAGAEASRLLPLIKLRQEYSSGALREFENRDRWFPEDSLGLALWGRTALQQGEPAEAADLLERALSNPPAGSRGQLLLDLARCQVQLEQWEAARTTLEQAREATPGSLPGALLGDVYCRLGEFQKAVDAYNQALSCNEMDPQAYNGRGKAQYSLGNAAAARQSFEKALSLVPDSVPSLLCLGILHRAEGDHRRAARFFEEALRYAPDDPIVKRELSELRNAR